MVEAPVRMFVGIGTGMLAILSFMVLTRNDGLGKFVHGDQRQNGFTAAASTSISCFKLAMLPLATRKVA